MNHLFSLAFFIAAFAAQFSLSAQWQPTFGPRSPGIESFAAGGDFIFAATANGVFRSADDGLDWQRASEGIPPEYAVQRLTASGQRVLAYSANPFPLGNVLFKSENNGQSWQQIPLPPVSPGYDFDGIALVGDRFFVAGGSQLWQSEDGGFSWSPVAVDGGAQTHAVRQFGDALVCIGYPNTFYRSDDGGQTWAKHQHDLPDFQAKDVFVAGNVWLVYADFKQNLWSGDSGATFEQITVFPGLNFGARNFTAGGGKFFGVFFGDLVVSDDGKNWSEADHDRNFWKLLNHNGVLLVGQNRSGGIWRSTDAGTTLKPANEGIWGGPVNALAMLDGQLFAGMDWAGVQRFDTGTAVWDTARLLPVYINYFYDLAAKDSFLFAAEGLYGKVYRTSDEGADWADISPPGVSGSSSEVARLSVWKKYLVALSVPGLSGGVPQFSANNGGAWHGFTKYVQDYAVNDSFLFYGRYESDTVFRTKDLSFFKEEACPKTGFLPPPPAPWSVGWGVKYLYSAGNLVFAYHNSDYSFGRLYVSDDNGQHWRLSEVGLPTGSLPQAIFGFNNLAVAAVGNKLLFSVGGEVWQDFGEDLPLTFVQDFASDGTFLYAATSGLGVWKRPLSDLDFQQVRGTVFRDDNQNGQRDPGENPLPGTQVRKPGAPWSVSSDADGHFQVFLRFPNGQDTLLALSPLPWGQFLPGQKIVFPGDTAVELGIFFPPGIQDFACDLTALAPPRPGFDFNYSLSVKNLGTEPRSGQLRFSMPAQASFVAASAAPDSIVGNVAWWHFDKLGVQGAFNIRPTLHLPADVPLGTLLNCEAVALPFNTDTTSDDNFVVLHQNVVGAFDPNDKQVNTDRYSAADASANRALEYTVRFQNTGNFPASRVRITDALDPALDAESLQILAASHPFSWQMMGARQLEITFEMINLPDSATDKAGSNGFVKFSLRPNPGLLAGAVIRNQANIIFDFNPPVATNLVKTMYEVPVRLSPEPSKTRTLAVFPNPNRGDFTISRGDNFPTGKARLTIFDLAGRACFSAPVLPENSPHISTKLRSGLYFLQLKCADGKRFGGKMMVFSTD